MESPTSVPAQQVHPTISQVMLADGFPIVLDLEHSQGRRLVDAVSGRHFLDMFSCFATWPIGINHPKMFEPSFEAKLNAAARTNPSNSDVYTTAMAEFVATWTRLAMPDCFTHLFLISSGTLAVENALKAAFDWKVRRNRRHGCRTERGHQIIHFREAFHGRSGYCLSLTNTADPRKHQYFPKFSWPRVDNPKLRFPVTPDECRRVARVEDNSLNQIVRAIRRNPRDIAAIIIEPIQGEGGDNHFRPEFLHALRRLADEHDLLLIFDEVQTGMGLTGRMWAYEHFGVKPDILVFGKKSQVCGIMAGPRLDEETDNVFRLPSRINSTLGGNLADMVRCQRFLEIMVEENLLPKAAATGLALQRRLQMLQAIHPTVLENARGQGLMCAIDFPDQRFRDAVVSQAFNLGMIILPCGQQSIRFRPSLDVAPAEIREAVDILGRAVIRVINS